MRKLGKAEIEALVAAPPDKRYEHFVKQVADWEEVWVLHGDGGWVMMSDGEQEALLAWPHAEYAAAAAYRAWSDADPKPIDLHDWLEVWTDGLNRDGRMVAVFPVPSPRGDDASRGIVVVPDRLKNDIEAELQNY